MQGAWHCTSSCLGVASLPKSFRKAEKLDFIELFCVVSKIEEKVLFSDLEPLSLLLRSSPMKLGD